MAYPYNTDPDIAWRTLGAFQGGIDRYTQLRMMQRQQDQSEAERKLRMEEQRLRLEEAKREIARRKAVEESVRGAFSAAPTGRQFPAMPLAEQQPFGGMATAGEPPPMRTGFDNAAVLQSLSQTDPLAALEMQSGFEREQAELEKIRAQTATAKAQMDRDVAATMKDLTEGQRAASGWRAEILANGALQAKSLRPEERPQWYDGWKQMLLLSEKNSVPYRLAQELPPQYDPKFDNHLDQLILQGQSVKDYMSAKEKKETPGVDVPFAKDVEEQKKRIARESRAPRAEPLAIIQTVDEQGKPVTRIVPKVAGAEFAAGPTADMRNKAAARQFVIPAVDELQALGNRVITEKLAIAQKTKAAGRSVEAALANDPDYRVYQDARLALAGNLAVLQQGSRPSDADIKSIWVPMVPDVFKDTQESAALKWRMIRTMSGIPQTPGGAAAAQGAAQQPIFATNPTTKQRIVSYDGGQTWEAAPNQ